MEEVCVGFEYNVFNVVGILFNELFVFCVIYGEFIDVDWGYIFFFYCNIFGFKGYDVVDGVEVDFVVFVFEM